MKIMQAKLFLKFSNFRSIISISSETHAQLSDEKSKIRISNNLKQKQCNSFNEQEARDKLHIGTN